MERKTEALIKCCLLPASGCLLFLEHFICFDDFLSQTQAANCQQLYI
jgi:hypothetical protein